MPYIHCHSKIQRLKDSLTYSKCQQLMLNEEIRCKKRRLRQLIFEYDQGLILLLKRKQQTTIVSIW